MSYAELRNAEGTDMGVDVQDCRDDDSRVQSEGLDMNNWQLDMGTWSSRERSRLKI